MVLAGASRVNNKGCYRISSLSLFLNRGSSYHTRHSLCRTQIYCGKRSDQECTASATILACCRLRFAFLRGFRRFVKFRRTFSFRSCFNGCFRRFLNGLLRCFCKFQLFDGIDKLSARCNGNIVWINNEGKYKFTLRTLI